MATKFEGSFTLYLNISSSPVRNIEHGSYFVEGGVLSVVEGGRLDLYPAHSWSSIHRKADAVEEDPK